MKKLLIRALAILLISLSVEFFIFNVRSFEMFRCKSQKKIISIPKEALIISDANGKKGFSFEIIGKANIPRDLRTFRILFSDPPTNVVTGSVYTEELEFRFGHTKKLKIYADIPHSQTVFLYPSKRVVNVFVDLQGAEPQDLQVVFNQAVPRQIQPLRVLLIFTLLLILYGFRPGSSLYSQKFSLSVHWQKFALAFILAAHISLLIFSIVSTYPDFAQAVKIGNVRENIFYGKSHYQLMTEALANGSLSLLVEPPKELETLVNPYDKKERESNVPDTLWDAVYYKGKYYMYFGIVPTVTLFLPYYLLTGQHLFSDFAVLFYAICGSLALSYCYLWLIRKYFAKIPAPFVLFGLSILLNSAGLYWGVRRSLAYETALVSAFAFSTVGLALIMSSVNAKTIRKGKFLFGCFLMACAVGCRPTSLFASLLILPIIFRHVIIRINRSQFRVNLRPLFFGVIPFAIVGAGLMLYNYLRFANPLEFGRSYQFSFIESSVYDNGLALPSMLIGVFNFLIGSGFQLTSFFPFIQATPPIGFDFGGFKEMNSVFSIMTICPFILLIPFLFSIRKRIRAKGPDFYLLLFFLSLIPIMLSGFSGSAAGIIQRYMIDFYWMAALAGILSFFFFCELAMDKGVRHALEPIILGAFLISIFFIPALSSGECDEFGTSWFQYNNPILFDQINYFFAFWL